MKLGCNHPIGPLALADMIGLDVCLAVMNVYFSEYNDSKYRPCPLLKEMAAAGYLGRKTGRGFTATPDAPANFGQLGKQRSFRQFGRALTSVC